MTARLTKPTASKLRPGSGDGEGTSSPVGPHALADRCGMPVGYGQTCHLAGDDPHENGCQQAMDALADELAAHATNRADALLHLFDAICHGLPAADAQQAISEWDAANQPQRIETT